MLTGQIAGQTGKSVIVDVGGVGYRVQVSSRTLVSLGIVGSTVKLLTSMMVREDAMTLYGFLTDEEQDVFHMLLSVQGVGAKVALALLSAMEPSILISAVVAGNSRALSSAEGVGPKLASRIALELRAKAMALPPQLDSDQMATISDQALHEVRTALRALGYGKVEADQVVGAVASRADAPRDTPSILSECLSLMSSSANLRHN